MSNYVFILYLVCAFVQAVLTARTMNLKTEGESVFFVVIFTFMAPGVFVVWGVILIAKVVFWLVTTPIQRGFKK